jgi:hypothetical protein
MSSSNCASNTVRRPHGHATITTTDHTFAQKRALGKP